MQARKGKEKASCREATTQEESGGRGEARQTAMEGEPEGHGRVGWLQAGPTPRTHPTEAMLKMAALLPLPLPPLPPASSPSPSRSVVRGPGLPGRRGWNGNPPGWPRSARSRNSSSQPQPTRHYPTASDKKERDRQRARERQTARGDGGRGLRARTNNNTIK